MKRWILPVAIAAAVTSIGISIWNRPQQTEADAAPKAAESNGIVAFGMEQQWLIHLKIESADQARLTPQMYSTGRIIPAPPKLAVLDPPVGGIIPSRTL